MTPAILIRSLRSSLDNALGIFIFSNLAFYVSIGLFCALTLAIEGKKASGLAALIGLILFSMAVAYLIPMCADSYHIFLKLFPQYRKK